MIRLADLWKAFGDKQVLAGVTLEVRDGETMVLIGYSGTGKSVVLKHIVGLLHPDRGEVFVDDQAVSTLERSALNVLRRDIGYVFQFAALFDSMTVADNVALGLRRRNLDEEEIADRVEDALAVVDLTGAGERYPAELSGGMRKRVGIARAIAGSPKYLLYDEPTSGLDPVNADIIDDLVVHLADQLGVTSVMVTHDVRGAFRVADRLALLTDGKIVAQGTKDEFHASKNPKVKIFLERDFPSFAA